MTFEITSNPLSKISASAILVFQETASFGELDRALNGLLTEVLELENFKGKVGDTVSVFTHKKIPASRVFVVGLGKKGELSLDSLRRAASLVVKKLDKKVASLALTLPQERDFDSDFDLSLLAQAVSEGILLGNYKFNKYKTSLSSGEDKKKEEKNEKVLEVVIISEENKNRVVKIRTGTDRAQLYCQATFLARDLVNEPASVVTPTFLAEYARGLAKKDKNIKCRVYDREELEKMGFGAFLGVAQAADTPPKFVHLEYLPRSGGTRRKKLAIVGKAITFDSGGVSVKTSEGMQTMKCDMAGAASVLAVFSVIPQIKPNFSVMGLFAATPNLISGRSLVPGDILRAYNGKTIEVLNTDAEGRVTLADVLSFAVKKGATEIIDIATLTGACMVALGNTIAGIFSNNKDLKERIIEAAKVTGEKLWELPLEERYKELNKSEVADIANIPSTRYGGAITATLFLQEFVADIPWAHLDIAGPAFSEKGYDFGPKGGTGFGVRTLLEFLSR